MKKWIKIVAILLIVILLLLHPVTRAIIIWILPLGVGVSDLIAGILIVIVAFILAFKTEFFIKLFKKWFR